METSEDGGGGRTRLSCFFTERATDAILIDCGYVDTRNPWMHYLSASEMGNSEWRSHLFPYVPGPEGLLCEGSVHCPII